MNSEKLVIINSDETKKEYRILCTFYLADTDKNYIVYTDDWVPDDDEIPIYASIYYPDDSTKLDEIKTDYEWQKIDEILNDLGDAINES